MTARQRRLAFVLAAAQGGPMIVNRLDYHAPAQGRAYGVGRDILEQGAYAADEVEMLLKLLKRRRAHFGDGVQALDCGANVGSHTLEWARHMEGWGIVLAIEAQERIFYALAGNIALNNCFNARALNAVVGASPGPVRIPVPDYTLPASFGSLELRPSACNEAIGQPIDYSERRGATMAGITIDGLALQRLDLLKIDVEGMEPEVLEGAATTLRTCRPIVVAEHIKCGEDALLRLLTPAGYRFWRTAMNLVAIHETDPIRAELKALPGQ